MSKGSKFLISFFIPLILTLLFVFSAISWAENDDITAEEIIEHIRYLASDQLQGRKAGTEGCEKAAEYIAFHFKKAGLIPLGGDGTYFQNFSFTSGVKLGDSNSMTVDIGERKLDLQVGKDFLPISFSSDGELRGGLVFAGYGISSKQLNYDDYAGIDVKDKIVLVLRYTPEGNNRKSPFYKYASLRYKAINAGEKGAKGIIFTTPLSQKEEEGLGGIRFDGSFADSGVHAIILKREIAQEVLKTAGKDMKTLEQKLGDKKPSSFIIPETEAQIHTELIREKSSTANVVGYIEGSDQSLKDQVIIIGAHYDHIGLGDGVSRGDDKTDKNKVHNGADDNASGIAGLIELAEYFSNQRASLKRSLLFIAFSAEELGLLGSSYYVKHPKAPLVNTVAMINMDMIGRLRDDKLTVFGSGSSPEWKPLLESFNSNLGLTSQTKDSGFATSDQTVFYANDIPVLHFFTGVHEDYHAPDDDWQKINSEGEKKILLLISDLIGKLNETSTKIALSKAKEEERAPSQFNVYVGTIPDYSEEAEGVTLMGVKEGSPADKAGLKGRDTIVEFGGKSINNIYDYVYALGEAEAEVPTEIVILREGKLIKLNIIPGSRKDKIN